MKFAKNALRTVAMFNPIKLSTKYINTVINNGFRTSKNKQFNSLLIQKFCKKIGVKYGVTVSSGTAGLHVALLSLELKKNDEVIMPAITMSAVLYSILLCGAKPVFADIDEETMCISSESVKSKITKNTKAIVTVSLFGLPPNLSEINSIIKNTKRKIYLIEDNAESLLAKHKKKHVGNFGDFSMFSFQASKILTCGEGGILVSNEKTLYEKSKIYSNLGYFIRSESYKKTRKELQNTNFKRHKLLGLNYRLSELGAATVLGQLNNVSKILNFRKKTGESFSKAIKNYNFVKSQKIEKTNTHSYWAFALIFNSEKAYGLFKKNFYKNGGDYFYGCWLPPYEEDFYSQFRKNRKIKCKIAEKLQKRTIQLKTNYYNKQDLDKQVKAIKITLKKISKQIK